MWVRLIGVPVASALASAMRPAFVWMVLNVMSVRQQVNRDWRCEMNQLAAVHVADGEAFGVDVGFHIIRLVTCVPVESHRRIDQCRACRRKEPHRERG